MNQNIFSTSKINPSLNTEADLIIKTLTAGEDPTKSNLVLITENARNNPFGESELQPSGKLLKDLVLIFI